jgi:hypothetical protein
LVVIKRKKKKEKRNCDVTKHVCLYASSSARFLKQPRSWEKDLPTRKH